MNVRLKYFTELTAGIFYQGAMQMNNYRVTLHMITLSLDSNEHNIALDRVKVFLNNCINSTVFVNQSYEQECKNLSRAGIKITTLPADPVDQIVGIMLYCKLNAIMQDRMAVHEIEISSALGDNIVYQHCDEENLGPFDSSGWWHDVDLVHYDTNIIAIDNIVPLHQASAWRDLDLEWTETGNIVETDNTVMFADFINDEKK